MTTNHSPHVAIIGGGPAGLMAAEIASQAGLKVALYEGKGSVGRKFLLAGKGGLNLTHSEPFAAFCDRFGSQQSQVQPWLENFGPAELRAWAKDLGSETFIGSSGRVFPVDFKAAPLLRAWVRRLRESGVVFHVNHRWRGWDAEGALCFDGPNGSLTTQAQATIIALGGGSWPQLGSDGAWVSTLEAAGVPVVALQPSNCGFDVTWSAHFSQRFAGHPVKPVVISYCDAEGKTRQLQGEFVITENGIEGSAIYALSSLLRDQLIAGKEVSIALDLAPGRSLDRLQEELARPRGKRSLSEHWRRCAGIEGVAAALLHEFLSKENASDAKAVASLLKALPLRLLRPRPLAEAISSAGGVDFSGLDTQLMARNMPGVFCAGEMLDWEAPTGGYLLTAAMASGRWAGAAACQWPTQAPQR